jgi:hypothetical protein
MMFLSIIPAGLWAERILERRETLMAPLRALLIGLIVLVGVNTVVVYGNGGQVEKYLPIPEETLELTEWLRENTPEDGRVLFAGPALHKVAGGHAAYLPVMAEREMMAVDFYHVSPSKYEYDYPPGPFRESGEGTYRFMELYNVTHVIAWHRKWMEALENAPDRYERSRSFGEDPEKVVYRVIRDGSSLFYQGSGRVSAGVNRIDVSLDHDQGEVVLRYNWVEGLRAEPPAEIFARDVGDGIRFIGLRPGGRREIALRY